MNWNAMELTSNNCTPIKSKTSLSTVRNFFPRVKSDIELRVVEAIRPEIANGPWIAGGAALNWYLGKITETDIDVWTRNKKQEDRVWLRLTRLGFKNVFETDNALTLRANLSENDQSASIIVQLIRKNYFNTAKEILEDFDFTVCQLASDGNAFIAGPNTYADIRNKRLRLYDYKPATFLARYGKYIAYGYKPDPNVILNAFENHDINTEYKSNDDPYSA